MEVYVDQELVASLTETQLKILKDDFKSDPVSEIKRMIEVYVSSAVAKNAQKLRNQWNPKLLARGILSAPLDDEEFAKLVFSQEDYK